MSCIEHPYFYFQLDIRLDWSTYNKDADDDQILDMLVFYGQPFPIFDSNGQELPPPPPICDLPCFIPPFIQVKIGEHEGSRSNKPFEVIPSQQVNSKQELYYHMFRIFPSAHSYKKT